MRPSRTLGRRMPLLVLGCCAAMAVPSARALQQEGKAQVVFRAKGPAGLGIEGKTSQLVMSEDEASLRFQVPASAFQTGIALRDRHLREKYLEAAKFPQITLELQKSQLRLPEPGQKSVALTLPGNLTMHGREKSVRLAAQLKREAQDAASIACTFRVDIRHFGIAVPSYLGLTVAPEVDLQVRFVARGLGSLHSGSR